MNTSLSRYVIRVAAINLIILFGIYSLVEIIYSSYRFFYSNEKSIWVFEDVGKTMQFDPIRGYILTQIPSRFARITNGEIEYIGTLKGNAQGFPDRDDFIPKRSRTNTRRFAVFGDSFTAGQFLAMNWPDRTEDLFRREGGSVELLNFSVDGGGLANWASIIRSIVQEQKYELDGLIFAVCCNDLDRKFAFTDNRGRSKYAFAYSLEWSPETYPKSMDKFTSIFLNESEKKSSFILSTIDFNEVLKGRSLSKREWRFDLLLKVRSIYYKYAQKVTSSKTQEKAEFDVDQLHLVDNIRTFARREKLPIIVVFIGGRSDSVNRQDSINTRKTSQFAKLLEAEFIDGRLAFDGMTNAQLDKLWLPYDGHWGLGGSDVFAAYMMRALKKRLENEGR